MRRFLSVTIAVAVSAALLAYALWDVDFQHLGRLLAGARYELTLPFVAVLMVLYALKGHRWVQILKPLGAFSTRAVMPSLIIGLAGNNLLPARLGELVRSVIFSREFDKPFVGALTSVALERLLDLVAVLLLYVIAVTAMTDAPQAIRFTVWPMVAASAGALATALALLEWPDRVAGWWHRLASPLPDRLRDAGERMLRNAIHALGSVRSPAVLALMLLSSLVQWSLMAFTVWLSLLAVGETVSATTAVVVLAAMVLAALLPNAPGFVGAVQAAYLVALAPFGVSQEVAVAASFLYLVGHWIPVTLGGLVYVCLDSPGHGPRWKLLSLRPPAGVEKPGT